MISIQTEGYLFWICSNLTEICEQQQRREQYVDRIWAWHFTQALLKLKALCTIEGLVMGQPKHPMNRTDHSGVIS